MIDEGRGPLLFFQNTFLVLPDLDLPNLTLSTFDLPRPSPVASHQPCLPVCLFPFLALSALLLAVNNIDSYRSSYYLFGRLLQMGSF